MRSGTSDGDAVELFARRAAAAAPGFAVTDANRALVARICRGLDGLPLAIELAAGRLRDLSLTEIADRLDQRLSLLTGGSEGDGGRHATARNVVAWSYDICTAEERSLWSRLSVFPGAFDVGAATEVCADGEPGDAAIWETLIALVDKSLLVRVDPAEGEPGALAGGGEPAFRMLDTVRELGAEMLAASGAETAVRTRFLGRYLALARQVDQLAAADNQLTLLATLHREHASIRAALVYALDAQPGQAEHEADLAADGAELATRLWIFWLSSGLMAEGLYWLDKALERLPEVSEPRALAHVARCILAAGHGAIAQAIAEGRAGVALAERLKRPRIAGRGHANLCMAYTLDGQLEAAGRAGKAAERLLTAAGDTDGLIILDTHLAAQRVGTGKPGQAIGSYQRGLARFGEGSGERLYHGYLHVAGALSYLQLPGKEAECANALSLALMATYNQDEVTGTAYGLEGLGWLAAAAGRHQRAAWLLGAADPLWTRCGARVSNYAPWEERHVAVVAAGKGALGEQAYAALFDAGARHPRDRVVALAVNDADWLDGPAPPGTPPSAGTLTDREREIAYLAAAGLSQAQIARQMFLPPQAVTDHLASVFRKLGVSTAAQLGPWLAG